MEGRPTFSHMDKKLEEKQDSKMCDVLHKSVDEKLECIPEMKERQIRMEGKLDGLKGMVEAFKEVVTILSQKEGGK